MLRDSLRVAVVGASFVSAVLRTTAALSDSPSVWPFPTVKRYPSPCCGQQRSGRCLQVDRKVHVFHVIVQGRIPFVYRYVDSAYSSRRPR
jgi:hypothetical protein